jgi:peroxiredoxin
MSARNVFSTFGVLALLLIAPTLAAGESRAVPNDPNDIRPILVGQSLPRITLKSAGRRPFDLNAAVASKPTILVFFRGGWCPYCSTHLGALQTIEPNLVKLGYQIIAVSADRPEIIDGPVEKNGLSYSIYSDQDMAGAKALGLAFRVDDETYEKCKEYGIDLEKDSGRTHHILPVPAALVLDTKGVVRYVFANPDYTMRVEPAVLLKEAKAALKK